MSPAFQILKLKALPAFVGVAAFLISITLGASTARAQASEVGVADAEESAPWGAFKKTPFSARFPNVVLKTHEGKNVRFYDDLLKDKIVLINFMYATCTER